MMQSFWLLAVLAYAHPELVVTTEWVEEHIDDPSVVIVDTRTRGYEESHIPGAVWLDINASRDKNNPPTYLPDLETFVATLEEIGISSDTPYRVLRRSRRNLRHEALGAVTAPRP